MRVASIVAMVGLLAAPAIAQEVATSSPDAPRVEGRAPRKQTLSGAIDRADRKVGSWFYRGMEMREQNYGLNGRKNSTNDAAERAETPRAAQQNGDDFSEWQRW